MKYDLTALLRDHRGKPITDRVVETVDGKPVEKSIDVTLGQALERAAVFGSTPNATAEQKYEQYKLAQKLTGDTVELTAKEVTQLQSLCAPLFSPIGVGAIWTALENPIAVNKDESH